MGEPQKEKPKKKIFGIELKSTLKHKRESEDAAFINEKRRLLVAADGVSRGPFDDKSKYPYPSPARKAAKIAVDKMGEHLSQIDDVTPEDMLDAVRKANEAIRELNRDLGLWENTDYLTNDLAGTVIASAVQKDSEMVYTFMGDSRVALIGQDGQLKWVSEDEITPIRGHFPKKEDVGVTERFVQVRRDFRNNPSAPHPTYGVLTGEDSALEYVRTGSIEYVPGDVLIAYTDGVTPFIHEDDDFRKLVISGNMEEINRYMGDRSTTEKNADDKTLLVCRTVS